MKQFLIRVISFLLFFLLFFGTITVLWNKLLNDSNYYKLSKDTKYIVFGPSLPECAFNDSLICNLSNFSKSWETYFYSYLKAKKIIANNKQLKAVFIEFTNYISEQPFDSWTSGDRSLKIKLPTYFPLLDFLDFKFILNKNPKGFLKSLPKALINIIGFNCKVTLGVENIRSNNNFGGYLSLIRDKTDSSWANLKVNNIEKRDFIITETNIIYLTKIIELCKSNNVEVFLIRSPLHHKFTGYRPSNELIFRYILNSKFANIEFLDFKNFPLQNNHFGDVMHLNYKGAKVFSVFFNKLLLSGLLEKENKQEFIKTEMEKN